MKKNTPQTNAGYGLAAFVNCNITLTELIAILRRRNDWLMIVCGLPLDMSYDRQQQPLWNLARGQA